MAKHNDNYNDIIIAVAVLLLGVGLFGFVNQLTGRSNYAYAAGVDDCAPFKNSPGTYDYCVKQHGGIAPTTTTATAAAAKTTPATTPVIKSALPKAPSTAQLLETQPVKATPVKTATTNTTGGSGGPKTDRLNLSFTSLPYTSKYHLYAGGLDWTKPVGLLLYTDGSGEYGLKHPTSNYLLGGSNGMVNVAKRHNMVLLTPFSPNTKCSDGDGSCWYLGDSVGYARWAEALVKQVESQYPIAKSRIAVGGYSSGAQFTTEWWVPSGAAQRTMTGGVIVAISYGGSPKMKEVAYTPAFKTIPMNWNVGSKDPSWTKDGKYSGKVGYDYYTKAGFKTSFDMVPGLSHERDGTFGGVMDSQISKHVS